MSLFKNKFSLLVALAFAGIYLIWGSTFLAISYGLGGFPPFILSGLRFFVAGVLLLLWQMSLGKSVKGWLSWKNNAITGLLILTGGTGLVAWGEQYISSTEAAIAIATGPFWFIALDKQNWAYYCSNKFILAGLAIGFAGLLLFLGGSITSGTPHGGDFRIAAFGVLALSSVAWTLGSLYSRKNPAGKATLVNIGQQLVAGGLASFVIAAGRGEYAGFSWFEVPLSALAGLLFLIFLGSIVAYVSYIWLLSVKDPVLVSTHTYINPIVAVVIGWFIAGESVSVVQLLGLAIILTGVLLTNLSQYEMPRRARVRLRRTTSILSRIARPHKYLTN